MPNPAGTNSAVSFEGFTQNPPAYGDRARQADLQRSAPTAGSAASPLNAPRRAQRQATRPQVAQQPASAPVAAAAPLGEQPAYPVVLAQTWAQVAAVPGASPLVQQMAQEAQGGV